MTRRGKGRAMAPRVGIFGKVGAGNLGNDASMESLLAYLERDHPDAVIDVMCTGPDVVHDRYGIDAINLFWHNQFHASGMTSTMLKVIGRGLDTFRTAAWVRRHDVVFVPGAGILEASLPMVPRGWPYALFLLSAYGKVFGTKVAFPSVGAGAVNQRMTRWLTNSAARNAFYRSYRDVGAREAMRQRGIDVSNDHVYPDLAFALPAPTGAVEDERLVAVGVMHYEGTNDERKQAAEISRKYEADMKRFVRWLVDNGRKVLLIVGDVNGSDGRVVNDILADLRASVPDLDPATVTAAEVESYSDVMRALLPTTSVVAIRYHNVLCSLKMSKPTISIGYSPKHDVLMANMGLPEFAQAVSKLDVDELIERFIELERKAPELRDILRGHNKAKVEGLTGLFTELSEVLFGTPRASMFRSRSTSSATA
jgi:polysaccharide pyruvyl transferase WcaK-like protein